MQTAAPKVKRRRDTSASTEQRLVRNSLTDFARNIGNYNRVVARLRALGERPALEDLSSAAIGCRGVLTAIESDRLRLDEIIAGLPLHLRGNSRIRDARRALDAIVTAVDDVLDGVAGGPR